MDLLNVSAGSRKVRMEFENNRNLFYDLVPIGLEMNISGIRIFGVLLRNVIGEMK